MNCCGRAVKRERHHLDVGLFHLFADFVIDEGTVGGHAHPQPQRRAVLCQLEDIGTEQRFAAGKDNHRLGKVGDLLQELSPLFSGEIPL